MVTASARLVVTHTIAGLKAEGGTVLAVNIDSLIVAATPRATPELVPCPGGDARIGRHEAIRALPVSTIEMVLDRTDDLLCPDGGHAWKREEGFDR
jgi:hypothetical protein